MRIYFRKILCGALASILFGMFSYVTVLPEVSLSSLLTTQTAHAQILQGSVDASTQRSKAAADKAATEMGLFEYFTSGAFLIAITGMLLGFAGWMLNGSIQFFVIEMGALIGTGTPIGNSINESWKMIRDLINLTFVFGLLYIAFMTIFKADTSKLKHAIVQILIGALLINFSLFFAKVIIDITNVAAVEIFEQMSSVPGAGISSAQSGQQYTVGISGYFAERLGVLDLVDPIAVATSKGSADLKAGSFGFGFSIFVSLIFLIASFVFMAGAILISIRFVVLVFLLILSPVAFASAFIPKLNTEEWSRMWWDKMISQAIFAPAYLLLILIAMKVADLGALTAGGKITDFFSGEGQGKSIAAVLNFVLIIGFLVGAIIIAKKMGAYGASTAASWGMSAAKFGGRLVMKPVRAGTGFAGRNTVGRASNASLKGFDKWMAKDGGNKGLRSVIYGSGLYSGTRSTLEAGKKAEFGSGYSFKGNKEDREAYEKTIATTAAGEKLKHVIAAEEAVRASGGQAAQQAAIEMERELKDASVHDIEELGDKIFLKEGVVGAMTHSQIEGLFKSEKLNATQKAKLGEIRQKEIEKRLKVDASGVAQTIEKGAVGATTQQLKALSSKFLTENATVAAALTASQMDDLKKEFTETEYALLKDAREAQLTVEFTNNPTTFFESRKEKDLAKMPKDILKHADAAPHLSKEVLKRVLENGDLTKQDRATIRTNLETHIASGVGPNGPVRPQDHPMRDFLDSPLGRRI